MRLSSLADQKAFTLLEVLLAAVVLAVGISYITPIFFRSADSTTYLGNRTKVVRFMDESIWEAKAYLLRNPQTHEYRTETEFSAGNIPVEVNTHMRLKDGYNELYKLDIVATWRERGSSKHLLRSVLMAR